MNDTSPELPVVVIGAGPVGLAAAAHLSERNIPLMMFESGGSPGAAVLEWGHIQLFSPWRYNIDHASRRLLDRADWSAPDPDSLPSGQELVEQYLQPLSELFRETLMTSHRVTAVTRLNVDKTKSKGRESAPFLVRVENDRGELSDVFARSVIDASGTWHQPNPLGRGGLPAPGENDARHRGLITKPLPDTHAERERFAGKHVLVIGGGHSAANTLLELAELKASEPGTRVTWSTRSSDLSRVYGGGEHDELAARGRIGTHLRELVGSGAITLHTSFNITSFHAADRALLVRGDTPHGPSELSVDIAVPATGFRPDLTITSELRLDLDPAVEAPRELGPLIDAEFHSCGTVPPHGERMLAHPEPGFYTVGMKSYGRAPTFLMATGFEQVRSIVAALAGDRHAADTVRLELPETGVCSGDLPSIDGGASIPASIRSGEAIPCCA